MDGICYKKIKGNKTMMNKNPFSNVLVIYGAVYGKADVTNIVRRNVDHKTQTLSINANNAIFGDSWKGVQKSLVIVWGYGPNYIQTSVVKENKTFSVRKSDFNSKFLPKNEYGKVNVLGAVYGLKDVSESVQKKVMGHNLMITANNDTFGNSWKNGKTTLVVVYAMGRANPVNPIHNVYIKVVEEGQELLI